MNLNLNLNLNINDIKFIVHRHNNRKTWKIIKLKKYDIDLMN